MKTRFTTRKGRNGLFQRWTRAVLTFALALNGVFGAILPIPFALASTTSRISVSTGGTQGDNNSGLGVGGLSASADGRYVAFVSTATNLVASDTNGVGDVFVRDRTGATTIRASLSTAGGQGTTASNFPSISNDGRYVAFHTTYAFESPDTGSGLDVYVRDTQTDTTTLMTVSGTDGNTNKGALDAVIDGNGDWVAFYLNSNSFFSGDTNGTNDVYMRDRSNPVGSTVRVSHRPGGATTTSTSINPSISDDGRYVVYQSADTGIVSGDTNGKIDVFLYDRITDTNTRVSLTDADGETNGDCTSPTISGDGTKVAFSCIATNMVALDTQTGNDVYVRDLTAGTTTIASVSTAGVKQTNGELEQHPSLSDDGRFVTFRSGASNLVAGDILGHYDIFVRDLEYSTTFRASVSTAGAEANNDSDSTSAVTSGNPVVIFADAATNLVASDTNASLDVFEYISDDITPPVVSSVTPTTGVLGPSNTYSADYTDETAISACHLWVDSSDNGTMTLSNPGGTSGTASKSHTWSGGSEGSHNVQVICTDASSNTGTGELTAVEVVGTSDLSLTHMVDIANPGVGATVTYTITVHNGGGSDATGVSVKDLLPAGVTYASDTPSQGGYVPGTGIWTVGAIADGASKNIVITATVDAGTEGQTITNTAQVYASDQSDPDSTPNNNNAGEDDQASADITVSASTNDATLSNSVVLGRLKQGEASDVAIHFTLQNTLSGTLTVTFPVGFHILHAATGGSACLSNFGYNDATRTLTATKTSCSGAVSLTGASVLNPSTPGSYPITWVNDDPGGSEVYIIDSDQVNVSADVTATITFDIDTATSDTESAAPYSVPLGTLTTGAVTGSDESGINSIWLDLDTNASSGAIVTVSSSNSALRSTSNPSDTVPSATGQMAAGIAKYGMCLKGLTTVAGSATSTAPFTDAGCTTTPSGNQVGGFTGSIQSLLNTASLPVEAMRAEYLIDAAISPLTPAHNDYSDTLKFIATGTF